MKKLICILFFTVFIVGTFAQRKTETINEAWQFVLGDNYNISDFELDSPKWEIVNLPHTWNAVDAATVKSYYRGVAWYTKKLYSPIRENKKYFLFFEGALQDISVYVNGKYVGNHKGGYTAFRFDITALLNKGNNTINQLAVKVDNSYNPSIPPLDADFTFWGGIYRDVYLIETNPIHFRMDNYGSESVFVETPEVSSTFGTVKVRGEIRNDGANRKDLSIITVISDSGGNIVKEISKKIVAFQGKDTPFELNAEKIEAPKLWSPESPYLYNVTTTIVDRKSNSVIDKVETAFGFRWFSVDTKNGFMLNGKPLKLLGVCRHQDYPGLGNALSNDINRLDIKLIKEMGANFIRISHYPQDPSVLEACNKYGLIVWEEIPIVNKISPTSEFADVCKTNLIEMIRQHYNHPSVMIWAYSNEVLLAGNNKSDTVGYREYTEKLISLHQQLELICRTEDSKRLTALAFHGNPVYNKYIGDIPMIVGWNRYDGWYGSNLSNFGKFLDEQYRIYPDRPLIISEFGAGSDKRLHSLKPEAFDFSIEYQQLFHESYLKQIMSRTYVVGASVWNFIDFGVANREESMPRINNKGLMYYNREPKDIYYFYQAAFSKNPVAHIASRDWSERIGIPATANDSFVVQPIKVFSNRKEIELFLNKKSLGKQSIEDFHTVYNVPFTDGKNLLELKSDSSNDILVIDFKVQPYDLKNCTDNELVIAVNAGSNCFFRDPASRIVYQPDQLYRQGSWGFIGGETFRSSGGRPGVKSEITATDVDPLYQTAREGMEAYKFDVPIGKYELELFFCEIQNIDVDKSVYDLGQKTTVTSKDRIFSVIINNELVLPNLNLAEQFNVLTAVKKTYTIDVTNDKGIEIRFAGVQNKALINGLKITRL